MAELWGEEQCFRGFWVLLSHVPRREVTDLSHMVLGPEPSSLPFDSELLSLNHAFRWKGTNGGLKCCRNYPSSSSLLETVDYYKMILVAATRQGKLAGVTRNPRWQSYIVLQTTGASQGCSFVYILIVRSRFWFGVQARFISELGMDPSSIPGQLDDFYRKTNFPSLPSFSSLRQPILDLEADHSFLFQHCPPGAG